MGQIDSPLHGVDRRDHPAEDSIELIAVVILEGLDRMIEIRGDDPGEGHLEGEVDLG